MGSGVVARGLRNRGEWAQGLCMVFRGHGVWSSGVVRGLQESWHVVFRGCDFQAVEHRLSSVANRLSHSGMWDLPRSEIKPMSLALAGR